jgi:hypothetical protein
MLSNAIAFFWVEKQQVRRSLVPQEHLALFDNLK